MTNLSGEISPTISITGTFDYSDEKIDLCWRPYHSNLNLNLFDKSNILHIGSREIINPSEQKELINILIENIKNAKNIVCISSFLIQQSELTDALIDASKRGIRVFLLTAKEKDITSADSDDRLENDYRDTPMRQQEIIEDLRKLFKNFAGNVLVRTHEGFHAKYCLVDPLSSNPFGLMMTCNATIDPMKGNNNIDIAMTLTKTEITSFFCHFIFGFWKMAESELLTPERGELNPIKKDTYPPAISFGEITLPSTTQITQTLRDKIIQLIQDAQEEIILSAWSFEKNTNIHSSLLAALKRDVDVKIFCKSNKRNTEALIDLHSAGAIILGYERFHAKCIFIDGREGIITTSNFTRLGLESGFETSVLFDKEDMPQINQLLNYWESRCTWELCQDILKSDLTGKIGLIVETNKDLHILPVEEEGDVLNPNPITNLDSCEKIVNYRPDKKTFEKSVLDTHDKIIKKLHYTVILEVPKLPKKGIKKNERKNCPFPSRKAGKTREYLIVTTWEQVRQAASLDFFKAANGKIKIVWEEPEKSSSDPSKIKNK